MTPASARLLKLLKSVLACAVAAYVTCFLFMEWLDYGVNAALSWPRILEILKTPSWTAITDLSAPTFFLMTAVGLPVQALWLKPPRTGLWWHMALGVALTTFPLGIILVPLASFLGIMTVLAVYPAAVLATVIFWLIRRPDKDAQVCEIKDPASCV